MDEIIGNVFNLWSAAIIGLVVGMLIYAYRKERIDWTAIAGTGIVGFICLAAGGVKWVIPLVVFFTVGNIASRYKEERKRKLGLAQEPRTWKNVFANGGAAAIFALLYLIDSNPTHSHFYFLGLITAMAVAAGDTFGTELGQVYGRHPRTIINLKKAEIGTEGAVSKEGLIFSLIGSAIISGLLLLWNYSIMIFAICVLSGFLGALIDSIFGCTLEQWKYIKHYDTHMNNFVTTILGGIIAIILTACFYS